MRRIRKYTLGRGPTLGVSITIPRSFSPFYCDIENGLANMWGEIQADKTDDLAIRKFNVVSSNQDIYDSWMYIDSFKEGGYTWHVYEEEQIMD